ncbi:hydrocephalus-inducing protein homolog [Pithys albifrons albifrons]|uniref:hydrocephalus-inducing protein homolog n=1 Tax=Pithys albifrons albifrons TaxID=3385563 RepID=UPI003A5CEA11
MKKTLIKKKKMAILLEKFKRHEITEYLDMKLPPYYELSAPAQGKPLIEPYPSEVVFQDCIPGKSYEKLLTLRNVGKDPQIVQIVMESSPYFTLVGPSGVFRQVPPNRFSTVKILFTSEGNEDHSHQLLCITEKGRVIVPIRAIGARPILDFPHQLDFSVCPVNSRVQKTLLVCNAGKLEARYHISVQSPFSVIPTMGTLDVGKTMQVTVEFHPLETGHYSKSLVVHYITGEDAHTTLLGRAVDVNIGLDKSSVKLEKTYLSLSSHDTIVIHNRSDSTAHFKWKTFATEEEENRQKMRLCHGLSQPAEDIVEDFLNKRYSRLSLFSHIYQKETAKVKADPMLFSDDVFTIEPLAGEIGPNSSAEISVFFKPQEVQVYEKVAYCDISGRENRLPLRLTGEGLGPCLHLNFEVLDIGKIFAGTVHRYEAILLNKGPIDAPFELIPPTTAQGSCFTFLPQQGTIAPNGLQPIQIVFISTVMGAFQEEFQFHVIGSHKPVTLTIRGHVTGVTLHFNIDGLHFGDVSFGFPQTLSCRLTNASVVPITFNLHIPEDGPGQPSITSFAQVKDNSNPSWVKGTLPQCPVEPAEFTITPCRGTIPAEGFQDIEVTLCSNDVGRYNWHMVLDVDEVGEKVMEMPITARCVVPDLELLAPTLNFGQCALKVPYQETLTLVNKSSLPGCYRVLPQKRKTTTPLWYSSPEPCGIIQPHSMVKIPITIEVQSLGDHSILGRIAVFGRERCPLTMRLVCTGQPPSVYTNRSEINFGKIKVLQETSQTLQLCNQSIIPAAFRAELGGKCWSIKPTEGVIPPKSEVSVIVTANLDDAEKFEDEVKLFVENSLLKVIPVRAVGIGTTVVIDKPFAPELRLGPQFSLVPCIFHFKVTNKGRKVHQLYWSTEGFSSFRQRHPLPALTIPEGKDASQRPKSATPIFKLRPLRMELMPGQTKDLVLEGFSNVLQEAEEQLVCHAVVGEEITKKKIIETKVTCTFISPVVQMSSREITFCVEKHPSDVLTLQYKPLPIKNTCSLPFSIVLTLEQPFLICDVDQQPLPAQPLKVMVGEELHLCIGFNPAYKDDLNSWETEKTMRIRFVEHPHEEQVTVRGQVYFPNLHIQPTVLDFGYIISDTEEVRYLKMTNCSPIPARYNWLFEMDSQEYPTGRHFRRASVQEPTKTLEAVQVSESEPSVSEDSMEKEPLLQVFNVLPVSGVLQPGETQQVPFTFFGHSNIVAHVTALCSVEGGPTYEVDLTGEASGLSYHLNVQEINCGLQLFNEVAKAEVTLRNNGKIGFTYTVLSPGTDSADNPLPGVPMVMPNTGYIGPDKEQVLKLYYLPGLPGAFCRIFQLQVGHLKPAEISLKGEAVFPRISMDLPWNIRGNRKYKKLLKQAKEKLEKDKQSNEATVLRKTPTMEPPTDDSDTVMDTWLKMEMEQMLMKESALKLLETFTSHPPEDTIFDKQITQMLLKVELPEYILDMGTVIQGCTETHIVRITNTGQFPVSFRADERALHDTGFSVDLEPVQLLTYCNTKTFLVRFESANLPAGEVNVLLPIKVARGPTLHIHLCATVVQLSLSISRNSVQFSDVQVGQCRDETIRLYNRFKVPCQWFITVNKPAAKKVDKHLTSAMHQKELEAIKAEPCVFLMESWEGILQGEAWCDLQIRFLPTEEKLYKNELKINLCGSSKCLVLHVSGQGLEPRLEFSPTELNLGAVLPCSPGVERTVVVKNPCTFPIEFYSLEYDEEYIEEEKILRKLKEFKTQNAVLMPPRTAGEKLPPEVLEDYERQNKAQAQQTVSELKHESGQKNGVRKSVAFKKDLVELCESPVYRSLRRYLGIDTSAEMHKAQNPRGIIVIVYGTPLAGKTTAAVTLSKYYSAACLSLDTIVIEAMSDKDSAAGLRAQEMCTQAALKEKSKEAWKTGKKARASAQAKKSLPRAGDKVSQKSHSVGHASASKKTASDKTDRKFSLTSKTSTLTAPSPQWLTITTITGEKVDCLSCVLPEDLLVDIISERLKLSDCQKGVVFDGLETLFASSLTSSLLCVLKAVSNCPHIFAVNVFQDYALWKGNQIAAKEREAAEKEQKAREEEEAARREEERLWNVDEDEYDALPEDQKTLLNNKIRQLQRERKQRELERLLAQEHQEGEEESHPVAVKEPAEPQNQKTESLEVLNDSEKILDLRFNTYLSSQKKLKHILSYWDRVQGIVPLNQEEDKSPTKHKGQKMSLEKSEKKPLEKHRGRKNSQSSQSEEEVSEGSVRSQDSGVPCLDIQVVSPDDVCRMILESNSLPPAEQILDFLGLGPSGPPIPPGAVFSMVPYPRMREVPATEDLKHFTLTEPEAAENVHHHVAPEAEANSSKGSSRKKKAGSRQMSTKEKRNSIQSTQSFQDSSPVTSASSPETKRSRCWSVLSLEKPARPRRYRWIVPAHGEVELKIHFSTTVPGQFEQMMNFELLGTKRLYQLPCSGAGLYPSISQNPRLVFPHCRKSKEEDDIIFKEYVMSTKQFHFGPLLCGKSREWYKAQNCPGNCEKITILNNSPMEAEVHFSFENDGKAETFLLDPPSMMLKPKEKQKLTLWAYPTSAGFLEDNLICCIKENPEPVVFQLCCEGVHVKLGVSPQELCFNKLLLHRTDSKTLVLINDSPLPMAWQLTGLDDLGDEFSISQDRGIVGPRTNFEVQLNFRAEKIGISNKMIRLEVSDTENILGIVHAENIKISVEVYDVNLSINMPKGSSGNLEFGIINVLDTKKEVLSLKNKGTYDIQYSFKLKTGGAKMSNLESHFTIQPQTGVLKASRPPVNVEVLFHPTTELFLKSKPILLCQVIDPKLGQGGKPVATIPVSVSARAVFSKYSIEPASPINFGAMIKGTKKSQVLLLENTGMLSFRFFIRQAPQRKSSQQEESAPPVRERKRSTQSFLFSCTLEAEESQLPPSFFTSKPFLSLILGLLLGHRFILLCPGTGCLGPTGSQGMAYSLLGVLEVMALRHQPLLALFLQAALSVGMFTVSPCSGSIRPSGVQKITVDCNAGPEGKCEEQLYIDISGRDPEDNPLGIPFTLIAESCSPALVDDITSIFEQYPIYSSAKLRQRLQSVQGNGVFVKDANKFTFIKVLVGQQATAHFKICNGSSLPCDVALSIKAMPKQTSSHISKIFKLDPGKMSIPGFSHAFAKVTFSPQDDQLYQCTFTASLVIPKSSPVKMKPQELTFTISGQGNKPQVTVMCPELHSERGNPVLRFRRLLLGESQKLPLVLRNNGMLPTQFTLHVMDEQGVFFLKGRQSALDNFHIADMEEDSRGKAKKPHKKPYLLLQHGQSAEFDVFFKPTVAQRLEGKICVAVAGNYEETHIELVGEGCDDDFTLDNLPGLGKDSEEKNAQGHLDSDIIEAIKVNHIDFGECAICRWYHQTFTITNHSKVDVMRFEWLADAPFQFSPKVGHLQPGCAKDIKVTLKSDVPVTLKRHPVTCKVAKIKYKLPPEEVYDWDDGMCTGEWVDATRKGPAARWPVKEKVAKTLLEPPHTFLEKSSHEVELFLSALVDYARFKLNTIVVQFENTKLFQTAMGSFKMFNTGNVALNYSWEVGVDNQKALRCSGKLFSPTIMGYFLSSAAVKVWFRSRQPQSSQCHSKQLRHSGEGIASSLELSPNAVNAPELFSIEPRCGTIPVGKSQIFQVTFCPTRGGDFKGQMQCRISNLKPHKKSPCVTVIGRVDAEGCPQTL